MGWFKACFSDLPDPRTGSAMRHSRLELLTIALTAAICGAASCVDFADFGRDRRSLFGEFPEQHRPDRRQPADKVARQNKELVENGLHWPLDTSFNADQAGNRKDHGPENLAILRKLALNVLRSARPDIFQMR